MTADTMLNHRLNTFTVYRCGACIIFTIAGICTWYMCTIALKKQLDGDTDRYLTYVTDSNGNYNVKISSKTIGGYMWGIVILFQLYILFDIALMCTCSSLFRKDLMVHHVYILIIYITFGYNAYIDTQTETFLVMGCALLVAEGLSVLNYTLRKWKQNLSLWRMSFVIFVRFPLWVGAYYVVHQHFILTSSLMLASAIIYDINVVYRSWIILKSKIE